MKLTPVEFEIMEIVWSRGSALVKEVHAELSRRKDLAYTTVMTEMDHMSKKGLLAHTKKGRAFLYTPRVSRTEALAGTVENFVNDYFHASPDELVRFISGRSALPDTSPGIDNLKPRERSSAPIASAAAQNGISLPASEERADRVVEEEDVTLL